MALTPVFYDFETFWSVAHSLSKMSGIEYVMHPDTEIISCSIQEGFNDTPVTYFGYDDIADAFAHIDWDNAWAIAHNNSEFDAMILAWRFHIRPKMWGCTLAMARPAFTKTTGVSLKALGKHFGLKPKGDLEATNTKGKNLKDFSDDEREAMADYNDDDTIICAGIFRRLLPTIPKEELRLIDLTIRMLVDPQFDVNTELLGRGLKAERGRKKKVLQDLVDLLLPVEDQVRQKLEGVDTLVWLQGELKSAPKFRKMLESLKVEVPMKESPNTGRMIPALAKNDQQFLALKDHPNEYVVAAVEARLDTQSSILETRMDRFIKVANMCDGKMPIALRYYGADTTGRFSGTMKLNQQNLTRVGPVPKISDVLRKSLRAPKGYKVVVADLSGIELRVNMFLWQVPYAVKLFTEHPDSADLYRYFAANDLYHKHESEITKAERQLGKVSHLGLGFGAGHVTFRDVAKVMGGVELTEAESLDVVGKYRKAHPQITQGWRKCHGSLDLIKSGLRADIDPCGLCHTSAEGIVTPKGTIRYPDLRTEIDGGNAEWWYGHGRNEARIYAGKIDENIVQHLARNVITDIALDMHTAFGKQYPLAHSVHDELVYVVKDQDADEILDTVQTRMRQSPDWWPELPTWSEGDIGQTYGDAK
ncbi:MAG: hypothetical protein HN683_04800 [Gammaproteobacteria bacterium]|nr:hypothetical protein [Gammaproteobacteria bacterium]